MYIVIKTVKGRRYRYAQWSWREGKKVRTKSRSLGPIGGALRAIGGLIEANRTRSFGYDEEAAVKHFNECYDRAEKARQAHLAQLHAAYGLRLPGPNPTPIEPERVPAVAKESPSGKEGQALEAPEAESSE